jgi:hypothetical protein
MSLIYKTLFEVKLMHEYYLTNADGKSVFQLANQSDRISFLLNQFSTDRPSVNEDVGFNFPKEMESKFGNYYLKLLSTYSGFKVAIRVNQQLLADGTLVYQPFVTLPDDLNIYIHIDKKSGAFDRYTHSGIYSPVSSNYIFSNEDISGAKTFPFITSAISAFDASRPYTQGDIASYGVNDIRQYYKDTVGDQWEAIPGSAFANENDRLLLPSRFYYSFPNLSNITNAVFVLKDKNDNTVKSISVNSSDFLSKTLLDFSDVTDKILLPETFQYPDVIFTLEVNGSNGYSATHSLIFNDLLYKSDTWGLIIIKNKVTEPSLNLLGNDGFLIKRKLNTGVWNEAPIFEIPIKSRFPFFRFINEKGKELNIASSLTDYLFKEGTFLLSKRPRSISGSYFKLQKEGTTDTAYIPNPLNYDLRKDSKERLCLDIMVPESDLFPVA